MHSVTSAFDFRKRIDRENDNGKDGVWAHYDTRCDLVATSVLMFYNDDHTMTYRVLSEKLPSGRKIPVPAFLANTDRELCMDTVIFGKCPDCASRRCRRVVPPSPLEDEYYARLLPIVLEMVVNWVASRRNKMLVSLRNDTNRKKRQKTQN